MVLKISELRHHERCHRQCWVKKAGHKPELLGAESVQQIHVVMPSLPRQWCLEVRPVGDNEGGMTS
jgi:hypothetical protein